LIFDRIKSSPYTRPLGWYTRWRLSLNLLWRLINWKRWSQCRFWHEDDCNLPKWCVITSNFKFNFKWIFI